MSHFLYLVRHGEQQDAEHGLPDGPLSARGKRQATLIADRISGVPFTGAWHSPLQRAADTAETVTDRLSGIISEPSTLLFDCIPSGPSPEMPQTFQPFFGSVSEAQVEAGRAQMTDAVAEWMTPSREDRHTLLITHNFVIAWFVREALDAPDWRWMGLNQANCGLTVLRIRTVKAPELVTHNDLGHLPAELRTGLPVDQPY